MSPRLNPTFVEEEEDSELETSLDSDGSVSSPALIVDRQVAATIPAITSVRAYHVALATAAAFALLLIGSTLFTFHYCVRQVQEQVGLLVESSCAERETVAIAVERHVKDLREIESARHEDSTKLIQELKEILKGKSNAVTDEHDESMNDFLLRAELDARERRAKKDKKKALRWKKRVDFLKQQVNDNEKEVAYWKRKVDLLQEKVVRSRRELSYCAASVGCHVLEI